MPEQVWHYLENQIDSVTADSRRLMNAILKDHRDKLGAAAVTDARLAPLVLFLAPVANDWVAKYGAWKNAQAAYRAASQGLENLLAVLREKPPGAGRSKIDEWASKIASFWASGDPNYDFLLPQGREPFTSGSRDEMIGEVDRLATRLGTKAAELTSAAGDLEPDDPLRAELTEQSAALTALQAKVGAFHTLLEDARSTQTAKEGLVDQRSALVAEARLAVADGLYHNLATLMALFYKKEERAQVTGFFDLALIMEPPATDDEEPDPEVPPPAPPGP